MNMTRVELCAAFSGGVRRPPEQPVHCDHEHRHGGDAERHPGKSPLGSFSAMYARSPEAQSRQPPDWWVSVGRARVYPNGRAR